VEMGREQQTGPGKPKPEGELGKPVGKKKGKERDEWEGLVGKCLG